MRRFGILLVRAYQVVLGPFLGGRCRFHPSCSNYAIEALERHGFFKGSWLSLRRLLRCRPFGPHGYDPVPETWPGFFARPEFLKTNRSLPTSDASLPTPLP